MAKNKNKEQTGFGELELTSGTRFTGIALNRDGEPVVLTEDGRIFRVLGDKWFPVADYAERTN